MSESSKQQDKSERQIPSGAVSPHRENHSATLENCERKDRRNSPLMPRLTNDFDKLEPTMTDERRVRSSNDQASWDPDVRSSLKGLQVSPRAPYNPSIVVTIPASNERSGYGALSAGQSTGPLLPPQGKDQQRGTATSLSNRRSASPGLKLMVPSSSGSSSRSESLTAFFKPSGHHKKEKKSPSRAKSPRPSRSNSNTPASADYKYASINYGGFGDTSSGRRSAPVFSRRHFGLRASGDRGTDHNLRIGESAAAACEFFRQWRNQKPDTESLRRSKSYGAFQAESSYPEDEFSDKDAAVRDKKRTKANNTKMDGRLDQIRLSVTSRNLENSIGQGEGGGGGYWSECETDGQDAFSNRRDSSSLHFHSSDSPSGVRAPADYKCLGWQIAQQSIFEDDDDLDPDADTLNQDVIPRFPNQSRRCRSETPRVIPNGTEDRLVIDFSGKSPRINYGTHGLQTKRWGELGNAEKGGGGGGEGGREDDEKTPLLGPRKKSVDSSASSEVSEVQTEVYWRRWYILLVFSLYCLVWNAIWSTWGPIAQSAKAVFHWSDANIAMFTWLGNIPFLVTMFPIAYLMDVKGMRIAMLLCSSLSFLGAGLRCVTSVPDTATWLIDAGQLLNGIAGTVPVSGSALVSGLWFPHNQRATATGISTVMGYLGVCISFVIGPYLVPEPDFSAPANTSTFYTLTDVSNVTNATDLSVQRNGIMHLMYYECGVMGLVFVLVLLYFPSKPPLPPSVSASMPREGYVKGIKMLVRNKQFWLTALAFSVPVGVYEVWQIVLDVNLDPKVTQETAGWMDFYATIGGCASGLLVSRFADLFTRQMRLFLIVFYALSAVASLWFTLLALDMLPFDMVSIYAATVICGVFLDGAAPLFFELVIEVSYPVGEGVTSGFLQLLCAGAGIVFLSLMQLESIGKSWMNWCLTACIAASVPLLVFIRSPLGRADLDDGLASSSDDSSSSSSSSSSASPSPSADDTASSWGSEARSGRKGTALTQEEKV